jgi:hypothetical protein
MKKINDIEYLSDEGKVFQNKYTHDIFGFGICLGDNDSIDNYIEIDCPEEYKDNKDYNNLIENQSKNKNTQESVSSMNLEKNV